VNIPDERLYKLAELSNSEEVTPASLEFVDIAGLIAGASKGEGLGNKFLSHIREVSCIAQVIRCFDDPNVVHVTEGEIDPVSDINVLESELVLADLQSVERRLDKAAVKKGPKGINPDTFKMQLRILEKIKPALEEGQPASAVELSGPEAKMLPELQLLTTKPMMYICNVGEESREANTKYVDQVRNAAPKDVPVIPLCASIEEEVAGLEDDESRYAYLQEFGLNETSLDTLIRESSSLLQNRYFFTTGSSETSAWRVRSGTTAHEAAGCIHSDMARGFIRAETTAYDDFIAAGGEDKAKSSGKTRLEGKEYTVQDGDVMIFRFNV
jgi:GTP-binding protein YchF